MWARRLLPNHYAAREPKMNQRSDEWTCRWQSVVVGLTLLILILMLLAYKYADRDSDMANWTNAYLVIALLGFAGGMRRLRPTFRSSGSWERLHTAALLFSFALAFFALAQVIWMVLAFAGKDPFPSGADVLYVANIIFLIVGVYILFKTLGANIQEDLGPFLTVLVGFLLLIRTVVAFYGPVISMDSSAKDIVEFALSYVFPALSALNLALIGSLIFGKRYDESEWGFKTKLTLYLMFLGTLFDYSADLLFTITNAIADHNPQNGLAYFNGSVPDLMFALALCFWSLAVLSMPLILPEESQKT